MIELFRFFLFFSGRLGVSNGQQFKRFTAAFKEMPRILSFFARKKSKHKIKHTNLCLILKIPGCVFMQ